MAPLAAQAGGMGAPIGEPGVVVVRPDDPVKEEPVFGGDYGDGSDDRSTQEPGTGEPTGDDDASSEPVSDGDDEITITMTEARIVSDGSTHSTTVSRAPDGRVLCLSLPAAQRDGRGAFDLCQP